MKGLKHIWFLAILAFSCSQGIDLPVVENLFVVEGWLSDQDTTQTIRLSRTVAFEEEMPSQGVDNAVVRVRNSSQVFSFQHSEKGLYVSNIPFAGVPGTDYWVEIFIEGITIVSDKERMRDVPEIDSLGFSFFEEESETNPQIDVIVYYPVAYISDPSDQENYFRWRFWKNGELFSQPDEIYLQSDRFFNGLDSVKNEFIEFNYALNDTIDTEIQEISYPAYSYLRLLKLQTTSLGTRQGTTPTAILGNLRVENDPNQLVLGYFGTISTASNRQIINP